MAFFSFATACSASSTGDGVMSFWDLELAAGEAAGFGDDWLFAGSFGIAGQKHALCRALTLRTTALVVLFGVPRPSAGRAVCVRWMVPTPFSSNGGIDAHLHRLRRDARAG